MILQEFVQPDWQCLAGSFNFSFKCGVWMECYMTSGHMCGGYGGILKVTFIIYILADKCS